MLWVRNSEVQDFLKNRAGWYYRWVEGLVPKQQAKPLVFGTSFHKFLEAYYSQIGWDGSQVSGIREGLEAIEPAIWNASTTIDELEFQDIHVMLTRVIEEYHKKYYTDCKNWDVIATELSFAIPLDDEIGFTGTIDLIVRDKQDGKIWFLDHKTTSSIEKYDRISDIDTQITKYWWALQQLAQGKGYIWVDEYQEWQKCISWGHPEPFGFIYNIILKDYPVPPKVLKDGSLSKAKNQKTTYQLYIKELEQRKIVSGEFYPDEYNEILTYLQNNPKEYFKRIRVFRNQTEIDNTMNEFYNICKEIKKVREGETSVYRTINFDTIHDPYLPLYQAEIDRSDVEYLKETLYIKEDINNGIDL